MVTHSEVLKKCPFCGKEVSVGELLKVNFICPDCKKYFQVPARERVMLLSDEDEFNELFGAEIFIDPINFPDYKQKYDSAKKKSGENEGVLCGVTKINGHKTCIFVMNNEFMMGSMGTVVGDRITALFEYATRHKLPVIGYTVSGGARMQEGILSLMQMAKVSAAVKKHDEHGLLYVVCLTDPTMGGVSASFAMLGDLNIAEPKALIGFAGPRVIEQTVREKLPPGFQRSEFLIEKGAIDMIVRRPEMRLKLASILAKLMNLPAPNPEAPREGVVVPPVPDQEPEA